MRLPGNISDDDEWDLDDTPPAADHADHDLVAEPGDVLEPAPDIAWLVTPPPIPAQDEPAQPVAPRRTFIQRVPGRAWAGLTAVLAVTVGVVAGVHAPPHPATRAGAGAVTGSMSVSSAPAAGACAGLAGRVVTDRGGDPATVSGVIAAFEDAYYQQRSAEAAEKVLAPESGITTQNLAAGIATIPVGTRYCVAITPLSDTTANVHLAEVHPDGKRVDYLQVINTISAGVGGTRLISHVQDQG